MLPSDLTRLDWDDVLEVSLRRPSFSRPIVDEFAQLLAQLFELCRAGLQAGYLLSGKRFCEFGSTAERVLDSGVLGKKRVPARGIRIRWSRV